MEVPQHHKDLLKELGLKDEDLDLFNGKFVRYEFDQEKGVRIYDPYYRTSYNEYIGIDGWGSWSSEKDTFMRDILKKAREEARRIEAMSLKPDQTETEMALKSKFGATKPPESQ